jgi:hypothetical protein
LQALGVEADASQVLLAALRVPAMGDAKVLYLAQLAHQHVLRSYGLLSDEAWMRFGHGRNSPTGQLARSLY